MNAAAQGEKALAESEAALAIQHYTRALIELPRAPTYYIQRSTAYSRLKPADGGPNPTAALRDAEIALTLARERGKRELILLAQMRRGVSLFQLERYGDAHYIFQLIESKTTDGNAAQDKSEGVKAAMAGSGTKKTGYGAELPIWMLKVRRKLGELEEEDVKKAVSVAEYPNGIHVPSEKELRAEWEKLKSGEVAAGTASPASQEASEISSSAKPKENGPETQQSENSPIAPVLPEKVRHEWYQSQDAVVVTLYAKGIAKDKVEVELKDNLVSALNHDSGISRRYAYEYSIGVFTIPLTVGLVI